TIGHSYRQSVLIMYLWAALFSVTVVSLSVVRTRLVVLEAATIIAVLALLPVTMPRLRPWHSAPAKRPVSAPAHARAEVARSARSPRDAPPLSPRARTQGPALAGPTASAVAPPPGPVFHAAPAAAVPTPGIPAAPATPGFPGETPWFTNGGYPADAPRLAGEPLPWAPGEPLPGLPGEPLPRAGRLPGTEPAYPADPQDAFPGAGPAWRPSPGYLPAGGSFSGPGPFAGPLADGGAPDVGDPLPQGQQRDLRPWWGRDLDFSLPVFTLPLPSPTCGPALRASGLPRRGSVTRWS
ncbi:MAG TPA: hypothetical protein VIX15_07410, partial [Streptosporangiaceae bacterium]